jgi:5-methylcytosine-specific restriction endonuclease McrA
MLLRVPDWPYDSVIWEEYLAYLESVEWFRLRLKVGTRCKHKCERCQLWQMEEVHHLTYERVFQEQLEDLVGLCMACHKFIHGHSIVDPIVARSKGRRLLQ